MAQMTWRLTDELLERVRRAARRQGRSMNEYVTAVHDAATDPELAESDAERVRERLDRAGLLAPVGPVHSRPPADQVARARAKAGKGIPLSDLVAEGP